MLYTWYTRYDIICNLRTECTKPIHHRIGLSNTTPKGKEGPPDLDINV